MSDDDSNKETVDFDMICQGNRCIIEEDVRNISQEYGITSIK